MMCSIKEAFSSLCLHPLRSFLALLGILIGTASCVAMLSCGRMAAEQALKQFETMGTGLVSIRFDLWDQNIPQKLKGTSPNEFYRWTHLMPHLRQVAVYSEVPSSYIKNQHRGFTSVLGVDEHFNEIIKPSIQSGRWVQGIDAHHRIVVIGHALAEEFLKKGPGPLLGSSIKIGETLYTIVGILNPWSGSYFVEQDLDHSMMVPYDALDFIKNQKYISHILFNFEEKFSHILATSLSEHFLKTYLPGIPFHLKNAHQIVDQMKKQGRIFEIFLSLIGAIALMVGGVGIMNVMLVTIQERKKEIGLRKALGASPSSIQQLFLIESCLLCLLGGVSGVVLGAGVAWGVSFFTEWSFHIDGTASILGLLISTSCGVIFGFYPAKKASLLEPIEALKTD